MKRNKNSVKQVPRTYFQKLENSNFKEVDPTSQAEYGNNSCFFYVIARAEVESCDTSRLLHDLRPKADNPLFKAGPGTVIFSVSGYDEDPRDLLQIPEFRSYVSKVQQQAPCWLYFAMPGNGWLRIILAAGTADCRIEERNGKLRIAITKSQVAVFMESQLKDYYALREIVGVGGSGTDSHLIEMMEDSFPEL